METHVFTSGILMHNGKILILKRKPNEQIDPNLWDCVGGYLKEHETAEACILRETKEETGLDSTIKKSGEVFEISTSYGHAIVLPFLLETKSDKVELTEHIEYRWVKPNEIQDFRCVKDLVEAAKRFELIV